MGFKDDFKAVQVIELRSSFEHLSKRESHFPPSPLR